MQKKEKSKCRTCIEEVKELETQEPNINNELPIETEGSGLVIRYLASLKPLRAK
jgi:hypothetical protein